MVTVLGRADSSKHEAINEILVRARKDIGLTWRNGNAGAKLGRVMFRGGSHALPEYSLLAIPINCVPY